MDTGVSAFTAKQVFLVSKERPGRSDDIRLYTRPHYMRTFLKTGKPEEFTIMVSEVKWQPYDPEES